MANSSGNPRPSRYPKEREPMLLTSRFTTLSVLAGALVLGGLAAQPADAANAKPAHNHPHAAAKAIYVCPMDPQVISDKPGRCPE